MKNRIFVVDDEADIKLTIQIALEENGFEIDAFDDPAIALDNFRKDLAPFFTKVLCNYNNYICNFLSISNSLFIRSIA